MSIDALKTMGLLGVHDFFDGLKAKALKWVGDGNELQQWHDNNAIDETMTIRFRAKLKPPPKRYTFAEAYPLVMDGKWMKPEGSCGPYRWSNRGCLEYKSESGQVYRHDSIPAACLNETWTEAE